MLLELIEFVFDSVYVDLQYDEISLTFTAGPVSLCCVCGCLWSVCEVVVVPYVDAMVGVPVMRVLLFVLHVCLLRECDGARLTAMPGLYILLDCSTLSSIFSLGLVSSKNVYIAGTDNLIVTVEYHKLSKNHQKIYENSYW